MNKVKHYFSTCLILIVCMSSSFAGEFKLAKITNDIYKTHTTYFYLLTSSDNSIVTGFKKKTYLNETLESSKTFAVKPNADKMSFTIVKKGKRHVVTIKSNDFAVHNGGQVIIYYLNNGITGKKKKIKATLVRAGDSWELVDKNNRVIQTIHFPANTFLGKLIGLDKAQITLKN